MGPGKTITGITEGGITDRSGGAGRVVSFNSGALAQTPTAPTENARRQPTTPLCSPYSEARPVAPLSELNAQLEKQVIIKFFLRPASRSSAGM